LLTTPNLGGKSISCVITNKDYAELLDTSSLPGKMEDVLKIVEGWDPRCAAILSKAPECFDWKLTVHDPLPTWVSKGRRIILIGDAAHLFLPSTSIQGASQAIEDGVMLAAAFQFAGKDTVSVALQAWERIRYQRVRDAQLMVESTRDKWHQEKPEDKGEQLDLPRPERLPAFDAKAHVYEVFDEVRKGFERDGYRLQSLATTNALPWKMAPISLRMRNFQSSQGDTWQAISNASMPSCTS